MCPSIHCRTVCWIRISDKEEKPGDFFGGWDYLSGPTREKIPAGSKSDQKDVGVSKKKPLGRYFLESEKKIVPLLWKNYFSRERWCFQGCQPRNKKCPVFNDKMPQIKILLHKKAWKNCPNTKNGELPPVFYCLFMYKGKWPTYSWKKFIFQKNIKNARAQ